MAVPISELFVTVGADITGVTSGLNNASAAITKFGNNIKNVGTDLTQGITVPIVAAGAVIGGVGADFEHAFTQVRKTVGGTDADLETLRKGLVALSTTDLGGGKSASELAQIAAVAGQLGIEGAADLLKFTQLAAGLSVATGISAAQVGEDLTRIALLTKTPSTAWENMASSIVALGNDMAGSEGEIIDLAKRMAGALSTVGVAAPDILGIASAVSALGIEAEAGGTAIQKIFLDMTSAVAGTAQQTPEAAKKIQTLQDRITDLGTSLQTAQTRQAAFGRNTPAAQVQETAAQIEKYRRELGQAQAELANMDTKTASGNLGAFAKAAGLTGDEFKALFKQDPAKAFTALIHGLAEINRSKGPEGVVQTLDELGINDSRLTRVILGLVTGEQTLDKALNVANKGWQENSALNTEVAKAMQDTENQFNLLVNQLKALAIEAWPAFKKATSEAMAVIRSEVIPRIQELVDKWNALDPSMQKNILLFLGVAAAIGPVIFVLGVLITAIGALLTPIGLAVVAVALLAAAWATNFGDIQGKTAAVVAFIQNGIAFLTGTVFPALAPAVQTAFAIFDTIKTFMGTWISFIAQIVILLVSIWDRALREIGAFFDTFLKPPLLAVAGWINDFIIQPLLALLRTIGTIASGLGITNIGGFDVGAAITSAEQAVAGISRGVVAGGPGTANQILVNINNPTIPDQTVGDRFAQQVQDALISVLVGSEKATTPLPQPGLPGQPF